MYMQCGDSYYILNVFLTSLSSPVYAGKTHVRLDFVGDFLKDDKLTKDLLYRDCSIREPPAFHVAAER